MAKTFAVSLCGAEPNYAGHEVPRALITIGAHGFAGGTLPRAPDDDSDWAAKALTTYQEQAKRLADALFASLPGGTIDALLVEMLQRKHSLLRVAHDELRGAVSASEPTE